MSNGPEAMHPLYTWTLQPCCPTLVFRFRFPFESADLAILHSVRSVHLVQSHLSTRRGKYPPLFTDTEANNCFSIYNTSLIATIFYDKMGSRAIFFSGNRQEVNSTWYPEIEEPIKSREKHYSLVLYILNPHNPPTLGATRPATRHQALRVTAVTSKNTRMSEGTDKTGKNKVSFTQWSSRLLDWLYGMKWNSLHFISLIELGQPISRINERSSCPYFELSNELAEMWIDKQSRQTEHELACSQPSISSLEFLRARREGRERSGRERTKVWPMGEGSRQARALRLLFSAFEMFVSLNMSKIRW